MNGELLAVFEYLERERGISRDVLIEAVQSSLLSAARKGAGQASNLSIEIERETGKVRAFSDAKVVEKVSLPDEEISLEEARKGNPQAAIGDIVRKELVAREFGRIAAQTAKQVIIQRIREAEHKIMFDEYKNRIGEMITGVVRRYERGNVILDLGKAEAILSPKEQCPRESYGIGRRLKIYILEVRESSRGPEIIVSRSSVELVRKLFELEVPELGDGSVEIKAIARDPGFRTKIAVDTQSDKIDAVGAFVGMRGARVKDVVRELNGERIDIVRWSNDMTAFITNALSPAKAREIRLLKDGEAEIIVGDDQFSLAMGKKGQGIKLISKLTGWRVDIRRSRDMDREGKEADIPVREIKGFGEKAIASLEGGGYGTMGALRKASVEDLVKLPGIGPVTAEKIFAAAKSFRLEKEEVPPAADPGEGSAPEIQSQEEKASSKGVEGSE